MFLFFTYMYMKKLLTSYVPCLFYLTVKVVIHMWGKFTLVTDAVSLKPHKIPCAYGEKNKV